VVRPRRSTKPVSRLLDEIELKTMVEIFEAKQTNRRVSKTPKKPIEDIIDSGEGADERPKRRLKRVKRLVDEIDQEPLKKSDETDTSYLMPVILKLDSTKSKVIEMHPV
jgi:hypothetical protein